MSKQVFRYLMVGMVNYIVYIITYAVTYNFIFARQDLDFGFVVISAYVAALGVALPVNFLLGFWLQRNISFKESPIKGHVQLIRHITIMLAMVLTNYGLTKLFVGVWRIFPTVAQTIIYCITAIFSFLGQKHFTFRGAKPE